MRRRADRYKFTDVSGKPDLYQATWRQSHKTLFFIVTAVRSSNPTLNVRSSHRAGVLKLFAKGHNRYCGLVRGTHV